ncbi:MAG: hypothetical protein GTO67_14470 [Gammaproteobacteria bacterium]|nr:hypothetical protein [Gammaproteobacteria bacterium]NIN39766.1 hypothetical protein [Gammaproteobacteria bacterium]NIO26894.1 hypothetical protein [Gammaproteobacteria bacterium]NIO67450.1 hypothetical protein [Gammaproteobacteria bacterium]NIP47210.1 hypothetical protein [Gammaproteobacteria bacterium]
MDWENLVDTLLNVMVFAVIGALAWLYLRKESPEGGSPEPGSVCNEEPD